MCFPFPQKREHDADCIDHAWCVGFEYGTGTIYFKDLLPQDGNRLGRWEGQGNALYMMCPSVGVNLAVGRPAKSRSVWSDETDPSKACDGDESRNYPNIFHSAGPEQEAWWSVELERPTPHPTVRLL